MARVHNKRVWLSRRLESGRSSSCSETARSRKPACLTRRHGSELAQPAADHRKTLVWIDDYEPGLELYKTMFESLGYRVFTASRGSSGLQLVASHSVDAVIVDYEMPEMNGEAVAAHVKNLRPDLPVVMFTGSSLVPSRVRNLVDCFCDKAGSRNELVGAIQTALESKSHHRSATPVYAA